MLFIEALLKVLHNLKSNTGVVVYGKVVESEYETVVLSLTSHFGEDNHRLGKRKL
jgi:hypothetical protein